MSNRAFHQHWVASMRAEVKSVGMLVFVELHRRYFGGKFGRMPDALSSDAFSMSGYCLDAPGAMPGGGLRYDEYALPDPNGDRNWVLSQFISYREGGAS